MKPRTRKIVMVTGVVVLVGFMVNTLLMLGQLKGLDSQLSTNSRLWPRQSPTRMRWGSRAGASRRWQTSLTRS